VGVGLDRDPRAIQVAEVPGVQLTLTPELERTEFASLMRSASVVVSPSTSDGTPNSLLEALACGASVLAADIPSARGLSELYDRVHVLDLGDEAGWLANLAKLTEQAAGEQRCQPPLPSPYSIRANLQRVPCFYRLVISAQSSSSSYPYNPSAPQPKRWRAWRQMTTEVRPFGLA
jgi:glycosyltransferase involved in cell wall biosynthesis